ncbi:hypothetical protein Ancab_032209 [Ancistrocladus abbreviatus]
MRPKSKSLAAAVIERPQADSLMDKKFWKSSCSWLRFSGKYCTSTQNFTAVALCVLSRKRAVRRFDFNNTLSKPQCKVANTESRASPILLTAITLKVL